MDFKGWKPSKDGTSSIALTAVALQDHWSRTLALGTGRRPRNIGAGPAARAKRNKNIRPVVNTGRVKPRAKKLSSHAEEDFVLDEEPPTLTLAQRLGLVDAPDQLLTEEEWKTVKESSNKREDSRLPCVICKEDFGLQEQVLLSCSHVFHRACLQAFERFTGRKTCPMCRREQYQIRLIHEGAKEHRVANATKIQAAWRGYVVRCWYVKLRQTHPPTNTKLRRKFFEEKLHSITDRIVKSCDFNVADFLSEMDQSLQASRVVFRNFDALVNLITEDEWEHIQLMVTVLENNPAITAVERGHKDCPICLTSLAGLGINSKLPNTNILVDHSLDEDEPIPQHHSKSKSQQSAQSKTKLMKAPCFKGTTTEIPPCDGNEDRCSAGRTTVLLSCSHVFHEQCLDMMELLALGEIKRVCPVCRTSYQKKVIQH